MNYSPLRISISVALLGSTLMACGSATDPSSDAEEATERTQQALRNCLDSPCEPLPPRHPPPSPIRTHFECSGNGLRIKPDTNPPECWDTRGGGRGPGGYVYVTRRLCPSLGSYPVCNAYGECTCVR